MQPPTTPSAAKPEKREFIRALFGAAAIGLVTAACRGRSSNALPPGAAGELAESAFREIANTLSLIVDLVVALGAV